MSNLNISVSKNVVRASAERLATNLRHRAGIIEGVSVGDAYEIVDWEALRGSVDAAFDELFDNLGIIEEVEFTDEGTITSDEYDEPDYYDDEVQ